LQLVYTQARHTTRATRLQASAARATTSAALTACVSHIACVPRNLLIHLHYFPDPIPRPNRPNEHASNVDSNSNLTMPPVSTHDDVHFLHAREWQNTVGQSGMTPTAFSFLVPVFVVAIIAPFLCIFCIRKRRQPVPVVARPTLKVKKPALRRAEAREKLREVTQISSQDSNATEKNGETPEVESRSVLEREWYAKSSFLPVVVHTLTHSTVPYVSQLSMHLHPQSL
jgi:hypothetical protein